MVLNQSVATTAHCINPECPRPYPQTLGHNFCNSCGSPLLLKNRYIPLQQLGIGGFAAIYTVWDRLAKTERVLKVLLETSPKALVLFEQEATVLAKLRHPGVPRVEADGYFHIILGNPPQRMLPCLVMEKIGGQTLEDILEQYPQGCPEAWVLNWLKQAIDILRELHRRKIIHRDIKPSNLMLRHSHIQHLSHQGRHPHPQPLSHPGRGEKGGQLVLIDFGGAKQISSAQSNAQISSTRLFSPGYSPPEQMTGAVVEPSADFYALGMTCIHLLTGIYPPDLEDPATGELRWRDRILINPAFAKLLDDMVHPNVRQRPANASHIRKQILKIYRSKITPKVVAVYGLKLIFQVIKICGNLFWSGLVFVCKTTGRIIRSIFRFIFQIVRTCVHTIWTTIVGGISAGLGSAIGFWFAYQSPINGALTQFLTQELPRQIPEFPLALRPEIFVFLIAGWVTAWSLRQAGGLGQYLLPSWTGLMGILGYLLGWFIWQGAAPETGEAGLVGMTAIAAYFVTVGLGLRSHRLVYALVAAAGTASFFAALVASQFLSSESLYSVFNTFNESGWSELGACIAFFGLLGISLGFWLGISHNVFIPFLRLLGWR